MTFIRSFLLFVVLALPALAADVVYPPASRIGLAPPAGMTPSQNFSGFEDRQHRVAMVMAALPPEAFAEIEKSTTADALFKQGIKFETREDVSHPLGKALLVIGQQQIDDTTVRKWIFVVSAGEITALVTVQVPHDAQDAYPDATIRTALNSVTVRTSVPPEEQLSLLPFKVSELAGFNVGGIIPGRAVMLTDATPNSGNPADAAHIVVAIAPGGPAQASERERFASEIFSSIPNLKDVRITSSEPLRINGQQGHQIMARGRDGAGGDEITIVQWIRFGGGAYLHLVGVARTEDWLDAYGRFRKVRDSIEAR
jgi:hypothetical protein